MNVHNPLETKAIALATVARRRAAMTSREERMRTAHQSHIL
jgi:hypothetical protein